MLVTTAMMPEDDFSRGVTPLADELEDARAKYRDFLDEYTDLMSLLLAELRDALEAEETIGVVYPEPWLKSLRRASEALVCSAALFAYVKAPAGCGELAERHQDSAFHCEELGNRILRYVSRLEKEHDAAAMDTVTAVGRA